MGDRIAVMAAGRVRQVGTPREIYKRPHDHFVADFIGDANFLEGEVVQAAAGEAWVRTVVGEFQGALADPSASPAPGTKVTIAIRPECLRLLEEPAEGNTLSGRIGEVTYFGEVAHYDFELLARDGSMLAPPLYVRICEINPRAWKGRQEKPLYAYADPDDVVILPIPHR